LSLFSTSPRRPLTLPTPSEALPGRASPLLSPTAMNPLTRRPVVGPHPPQLARLLCGMGCFWGAERLFWQTPGVVATAVGYAGGYTPHPTYQEVCSGQTGHTEVVEVWFDPAEVSLEALLRLFWERHDPTQGMRQGGDVGTQYRSALYWGDEAQRGVMESTRAIFAKALAETPHHTAAGAEVTTTLEPAPPLYYAEEYHQQYLHKNPDGYCGLRGTGLSCVL
jgi:peptide-methionine (S)-S-oxide reductase